MSSDGRPTLLIVDDEPGNVRVLTEVLRDVGNLRIATSGDRALALGASDDPPDLILLDVEMPGLDGWETCRRLKADPRTAPIPVIFITGLQDERDEVRGFEAGAVDYVTKPFRPVVVRARVRTQLELKGLRDRLEAESRLDALTGIANRRRFGEALASAWDLSSREGGTLALVLADIDHFKAFNDRFGHPEGDVCLRRVSGALSGATRRKSDLLARWGGEEFVCLLPGTTLDGALRRAETYRTSVLGLSIPAALGDDPGVVSISQGVAVLEPGPGADPLRLVEAADQALYEAKAAGRNCIRSSTDRRSGA